MPGKEAESSHGVTPVSWKRDCDLKVRASLRPADTPRMPYGAGSLQQWLGLLKSCPLEGVWLVYKDVRAPVQLCPTPQSCSREPCEPRWCGGHGVAGEEGL